MPEAKAASLVRFIEVKDAIGLAICEPQGGEVGLDGFTGGFSGENRWWKPVEGRRPHA